MTASKHLRLWLLLACGLVAARAAGTQTVSYPFLGVKLYHQIETSPRPLNINVVEIDLTAPGLSFQVTPKGPEPRPLGTNPGFVGQPMETIRQTPRQYANSAGAQIAINASFYSAQEFDGVFWANNLGLTASNGTAYSPWEAPPNTDNNFDDALNITAANQAQIVKMASSVPTGYETLPSSVSLYNTVTGQDKLLQSGVVLAPSSSLAPRTAFGLTAGNTKLLLMTVDGRQTGFSEGVTLVELANLMASYGATNAIGMDGGGSTQMAMNYYGDGLSAQLVNVPSETERLVGTSLAVFALPNGDYNQNGAIDTADYVVWRRTLGQQSTYDAWRQRYGNSSGTGSVLEVNGGVPEPTSVLLAAWSILGLLAVRRPARGRRLAEDRPD